MISDAASLDLPVADPFKHVEEVSFDEALNSLLTFFQNPPSGFEHLKEEKLVPNLSNAEAVISYLNDFIGQLKQRSQIIEYQTKNGLTDDEVKALHVYKIESPYPVYKWLNAWLMSSRQDAVVKKVIDPFFVILRRAMSKLPKITSKASRAIKVRNIPALRATFNDYEQRYALGEQLSFLGFASFSTDDKVTNSEKFSGGRDEQAIIFSCGSLEGVDMEPFAPAGMKEKEILPMCPTIFEVQSAFMSGCKLIISVKQLDNNDFAYVETNIHLNADASNIATPEELKELTPEQMSNYTEGPILGRGASGTVYLAMLSIGKLVAVKVVPIDKKQKAESVRSIKREVDILRDMSHPNVIRCYGCSYSPKKDSICIFMELATSGSLTEIVRRFGGLGENIVQVYTKQILKGLQYLHGRGVIHRDIKGENILIDGNGSAKLGDFGWSKYLQDVANKSQAGCASFVGTPFWMAPEVIRNENYGTKADVWSLGCTVVEMLNGGHPPWKEKFDNLFAVMHFIVNATSLPSNIPGTASDLCKDFLAKCFARDASKRASVSELLNHPWLNDSNMGSPLAADQLHIAIQHGHNISGTSQHESHTTSFNSNLTSHQNSAYGSHRGGGAGDNHSNEEDEEEENYDEEGELDEGESSLHKPPPKIRAVHNTNGSSDSIVGSHRGSTSGSCSSFRPDIEQSYCASTASNEQSSQSRGSNTQPIESCCEATANVKFEQLRMKPN